MLPLASEQVQEEEVTNDPMLGEIRRVIQQRNWSNGSRLLKRGGKVGSMQEEERNEL